MSTQKITEKILADARARAQEILDSARQEAGKVVEAALAQAEKDREHAVRESAQKAEMEQKRIVAAAHMEERRLLLAVKQELIEEAFQAALLKIRSLNDDEFERLMAALMVNLIETGDETVIINEQDKKRLSADFIYYVNRTIEKEQVPCHVTMSEEQRDMASGFILKRGNVEINATFEALLRQQRDTLSGEIVKILF